jgi:hypothetical protein
LSPAGGKIDVVSVTYPTRALIQDPEPDTDVGDALVKVTKHAGRDKDSVVRGLEIAGAVGVVVVGSSLTTPRRDTTRDPLEQVKEIIRGCGDDVSAKSLQLLKTVLAET